MANDHVFTRTTPETRDSVGWQCNEVRMYGISSNSVPRKPTCTARPGR